MLNGYFTAAVKSLNNNNNNNKNNNNNNKLEDLKRSPDLLNKVEKRSRSA